MRSPRHHAARVPQARRRLARLRRTIHDARSRPPRQHRRSNRSLQIDRNVVPRAAHVVPHARNLLRRRNGEQRLPPSDQIHGMHPVHQRTLRRTRPATRRSRRTQQLGPTLFDKPSDLASGNASRRACAAGRVWITSPIALSRTISRRSTPELLAGAPLKISSEKVSNG